MTQMRIDIKDYVVKRVTLAMVKNTNVSIKTIMNFVNNIEDIECSLGDGKINWNKAMQESDEEHELPSFVDNDGCAFEDGVPLPLDEKLKLKLEELKVIEKKFQERQERLRQKALELQAIEKKLDDDGSCAIPDVPPSEFIQKSGDYEINRDRAIAFSSKRTPLGEGDGNWVMAHPEVVNDFQSFHNTNNLEGISLL